MRTPVTLVTAGGQSVTVSSHGSPAPRTSHRHDRHRAARGRPGAAGSARVHRLNHRFKHARACARGVRGRPVFHLAALLSTRVRVHADCCARSQRQGDADCSNSPSVKASRTAGPPSLSLVDRRVWAAGPQTKMRVGRVREDDWNTPTTMYGCNKLYCEHLGRYYARLQAARRARRPARRFPLRSFSGIDFRGDGAVGRDVGLCTGDDSRGRPGASLTSCFVRPDTRIPFMAMPDAIEALLRAG